MKQTVDNRAMKNVGKTFVSPNVLIADGSVIPTSIGVNPQRAITAITRFTTENIYKKDLCYITNRKLLVYVS